MPELGLPGSAPLLPMLPGLANRAQTEVASVSARSPPPAALLENPREEVIPSASSHCAYSCGAHLLTETWAIGA